ncbi:MAG: hypothetical protein JNM34_06525 [Chthonomonadaceae bacterium]|nr:hypothetical protein [Chthonomonadaceae bacterium]
MTVALLTLLYMQDMSPFDRAESAWSSMTGLSAKLTATLDGETTFGSIVAVKPDSQVFRLKGKTWDFEFFQDTRGTVLVDHIARDYCDAGPSDSLADPPHGVPQLFVLASPARFVRQPLGKIAPKERWRSTGMKKVGQVALDCLSLGNDDLIVCIDRLGRIGRIEEKFTDPNGQVHVAKIDWADVSYSYQLSGGSSFSPPLGYSPWKLPSTNSALVTGEPLKEVSVVDLGTGSMRKLQLPDKCLLILLSSDLDGGFSDLEQVLTKSRAKKIEPVIVWIGQKPNSKTVQKEEFWDQDARIERTVHPPVTPYFLRVDHGTYLAGWQGWRNEESQEALDFLLADR